MKVYLLKGNEMQALNFLKKTFSFDDRSMALYRFLIGWVVVADVLYRLEDFTNFYTDVGLVPRSTFTGEMSMPWSFSVHLANGSLPFIVAIFSLHLILGLMVVLGYKTRWALLGAFVMTVSVHNRNWLVNNGGDDILRAILFLSIFLPLGRTFSLDSALCRSKQGARESFSAWNFAFFLQVFVIYFVGYILKDHPIWRGDYTAVFYSSRLDIFATPFAIWLRGFPEMQKIVTIFTIFLEWLGPLFLVFGFMFGKRWWIIRTGLVVTFIGFHFGIFLSMNIGLFTFICMSMWTIFLPGEFWDWIGNFFKKKSYHRLSIYFDKECGFCEKGVRVIKSFLLFDEVEVRPAQDHPAIHSLMVKNHSWVVVNETGEELFHYGAWIGLLRHSPFGFLFLWFFDSVPAHAVGSKVYHWVSHNRPFMGKVSQFLMFREPKKEIRVMTWVFELAGAFMFVTLLMWNLTTIKKLNIRAPFFQTVTRWFHLYQEWNMFAPYPKMDNIWVEIPGTLGDGSEIDVLTGSRDIFGIKDQLFYQTIPNEHWRKFYLNLSDRTDYARYYGGYLCRLWNERKQGFVKNTTLRKLEIIVFSQPNLPDGDKGGISRKLSWRHWCFDEEYRKENPPRP